MAQCLAYSRQAVSPAAAAVLLLLFSAWRQDCAPLEGPCRPPKVRRRWGRWLVISVCSPCVLFLSGEIWATWSGSQPPWVCPRYKVTSAASRVSDQPVCLLLVWRPSEAAFGWKRGPPVCYAFICLSTFLSCPRQLAVHGALTPSLAAHSTLFPPQKSA